MKQFIVPLCIVFGLVSFHCKSDTSTPRQALGSVKKDAAGALVNSAVSAETITMTTADKVIITGTLYKASGNNNPAVLCLHQWRSGRAAFADLAEVFSTAGITVLAIDMRGYGDSQKKSDGSRVDPDRMAVADVAAAISYLQQLSGVDKRRIGILGASYGSSNALLYAADHTEIQTLALLSPGLNFFNVLPTEPAMKKMSGRNVIAVTSSDDFRSVEAVQRFQEITKGKVIVETLKNAGHGTEMLNAEPRLMTILKEFFMKNL